MSGLGALLGGVGLGAAQAYSMKKTEEAENAFQDKRDAAIRDGTELPKRVKPERNIDVIAGKIKGFLSGDKAAGDLTAPATSIEPVKPISSTAPVVDAAAFNDDSIEPNEPVPFKCSYT